VIRRKSRELKRVILEMIRMKRRERVKGRVGVREG